MIIAPHQREVPLVHAFVRLTDTLVPGHNMIDVFHGLCEACVTLVGADAAGLVLADQRGGLQLAFVVDTAAEFVRSAPDEGPAADCFRTSAPVHAPDLTTEQRWPRFTAYAAAAGVAAVDALPMHLRGRTLGVLTLFHREPRVMGEADLRVGQALADVATIAILTDRANRERDELTGALQDALTNRVVIEQAKGVLAERGGIGLDSAFTRLLDHAGRRGRRLAEIARDVVDGGPETADLIDEEISRRGAVLFSTFLMCRPGPRRRALGVTEVLEATRSPSLLPRRARRR